MFAVIFDVTAKFRIYKRQFLMRALLSASVAVCTVMSLSVQAGDYSQRQDVDAFINKMVEKHDFARQDLQNWLGQAEKKQSILDAISRPAEKTKPWKDYRKIFISDDRIQKGVEFWLAHEQELQTVAEQYQVNPEIIVAIIGVETRYGKFMGSYRVIDALSTLGFDYPPRGKFFLGQLEEFFLLAREQNHDPLTLSGSYAGAMGYGQFIPSSYRSFAVDFDGDNFADIWENTKDALASVANYFAKHKWHKDELVATRCHMGKGYDETVVNQSKKPTHTLEALQSLGYTPVTEVAAGTEFAVQKLEGEYGAECWLTAHNFYVITRYNHSVLYALSVYQLSEGIQQQYQQALKQALKQAQKSQPSV